MLIQSEILEIANRTGLKIIPSDNSVTVKHRFSFKHKTNWGILIFLCGGIFLIVFPFIKSSDIISKIIGVSTGLSFLIMSFLTILRQSADKVTMTNIEISFRYKLKFYSIPVSNCNSIKMKTEKIIIKRAGTPGSEFISVTLYILLQNTEIPFLNYIRNIEDSDNAIILGKELTKIFNSKLQQKK